MIEKTDFKDVYTNHLTPKQRQVLPLLLAGESDEDIAKHIGVTHRTTATHHIRKIARLFGIDIETDTDYKSTLVELFLQHKPELVTAKGSEKYGFVVVKVPYPQGAEPLQSPFYIERSSVESICYSFVQEPGALIRIKAPKQMGKTSLLKRIIANCEKYGYHSLYLNFALIDKSRLNHTEDFFRSFYAYTTRQITEAPPLGEWDLNLPNTITCTTKFQGLLRRLDQPLVLVLDEVDKIFDFPDIYETFAPMLRTWHEKGKDAGKDSSKIWEKLRLVIAHSTEEYGRLDINQSPFQNVGKPIELMDLHEDQVIDLASRHSLPKDIVAPLISLLGGHPYLLRLAFYYLKRHDLSLNELIRDAKQNGGIYQEHLRRHFEILQDSKELFTAFKQIIFPSDSLNISLKTKFQLAGMGLTKQDGDKIIPSCNLYALYFQKVFNLF